MSRGLDIDIIIPDSDIGDYFELWAGAEDGVIDVISQQAQQAFFARDFIDQLSLRQMSIVGVHISIARCQYDVQPFLGDHARDEHPGFHDSFSLLPARHCSENRYGWVDLSWLPVYHQGELHRLQ